MNVDLVCSLTLDKIINAEKLWFCDRILYNK